MFAAAASMTVAVAVLAQPGDAAISFGAPALLPAGLDARFPTGFQGTDASHALGNTPGGWVATSNAGSAWSRVDEPGVDVDITAAVVSSPGVIHRCRVRLCTCARV